MDTFSLELDKLLKEYLDDESFANLSKNLNLAKEKNDGISERISNFYNDQLHIDSSSFNERIKIDRTITFSEKHLEKEIFCKFLLDIGRICLTGSKLDLATEFFNKSISNSSKTIIKAESLIGLAEIYSKRANWTKSLIIIAEAETLYKKINDKIGLAKCENMFGYIFGKMGDIENARACFIDSLALISPETDHEMAANLETNIGIIDNLQGNSSDALRHLNNALEIYKKLNNYKSVSEVLYNIGMVYLEMEEYELAISSFDEGIEIAKQGQFVSVLCHIYLAKSRALIAMNAIFYAAKFADKAMEISHAIDDKLTLADIYKVKGSIERHLKNFAVAENNLGSSLRINTVLRSEMKAAETSLEFAVLYKELNNPKSKELYLKSSLNYYREINASGKVKKIEEMLSIAAA